MVRLREPTKPQTPVVRRVLEVTIVLGVLGVVAMNSWQAFGAKLWAKANTRTDSVTVLDDCVGGLCMNGANAEATAANGASDGKSGAAK
jgi:hypothetical protein